MNTKPSRKTKKTAGSDRKTFVLDTNVFLHDPHAIYAFDDNDIVIPMIVLEEIDSKKDRMDEVGSNARRTCRILDELGTKGSLRDGVEIQRGGMLRVLSAEEFQGSIPDDLNDMQPDNMIIAVAVGYRDKHHATVSVITRDINMRIKCNVIGMPCDDYKRFHVATVADELYTGIRYIKLTSELVQVLRCTRALNISAEFTEMYGKLHSNEFIVDDLNDIAGRVDIDGSKILLVNEGHTCAWLKPRNLEQKFAMRLMFDDRIKLVSLIGAAGTGKTLLAVASALDLMLEQKKYSKIVISRPIQPLGKDIGYLPGTKDEKMSPWVQPIYDNIEFLMGHKGSDKTMFDMLIDKGRVEVEAITYIRGRSIANAIIIIDEAQNLSAHELKTIITRVGEGTKIVLTGDIQQIDNSYVDAFSNGLTYAVEKFKDHGIAGHVTLHRGERSDLASLASKIL